MLDQLIFLLITTILTFIIYPFWINFVYKYHMGEQIRSEGPNSHIVKKGTPTMGGLVFLLTVSVITLAFNKSRTQTLFPILVTAMAGLFGIMEDLSKVYKTSSLGSLFSKIPFVRLILWPFKFLSPLWNMFKEGARIVGSSSGRGIQTYQKFLIQTFIGGFVAYWTYFKLGWDYIWFPLVGDVHIGFFYPIFIFFLFLAVLNFVAFTDGIDGLAGGLALIAFGAFWVISSSLEFNSLATLAATFVGALIPFLYFNIYPARIFMGDVGSHVLGASLAVFSVLMHREVAMFIILGVFLFDGISSPLQQLSVVFTKKRLFRMAPIHHHFELLGWPETKVTLRFWLFGILAGLFGIFISLL
jgi:phospho-N-acetylmuramoyl-pentapeptide-transferase